ncbi:hypothetical protein ABZX12_22540 [Kribbella sp. NPDC003505]|uniref:DUF222 domain-containing protein n=1 Tax=Kribbella sp. NPDC003505 TaxID=3154448 RepID=UPI0033A09712
MFDTDLEDLATADLLAAAAEYAQIENRAATRILEAALAYADRNAVAEGYEPLPGYERVVVYGGDGCPGVAEFAPIELGAVLGISSGAAASLIGEALALRHRLPTVWAAVLSGTAIAWRARKIAHACLTLSQEAAAIVDRRVAAIINTVTPRKLAAITTAAIWAADPEQARANAEAAAKTRGVFVSQSDDHGTKRIWVRAAAGDVIRFDAKIDDLAQALEALGDTDTLDQRRAKAVGWISDPASAHHLIEVARHLARVQSPPVDEPADADRVASKAAGAVGGEPTDAEVTDAMMTDSVAAPTAASGEAEGEDGFTRRALAGTVAARFAAIKRDAYGTGLGAVAGRRDRHILYVHLTDKTLATGAGVLRVEKLGPLLASQLTELLGHDQVVVKPVIDLHDQVSVHSYEIPDRIRERVRLRHPVDMFPYGGAEATTRMDQDHITPYRHTERPVWPSSPLAPAKPPGRSSAPDRTAPPGRTSSADRTGPPGQTRPPERTGPPGQTSVDNLIPQSRLHHRAKTFGGWRNRRLPTGAIEWTSPHGFRFLVDHNGTHQLPPRQTRDRRTGPRPGA